MKNLLMDYSISDILIFIVILALAVKEGVTLVDWAKDRLKKTFDKDYHAKEEKEHLEEEIEDLNKFYDERKKVDDAFEKINKAIENINTQIELLTESDKEDIKSFITIQHHHFVYDQGWIDDYSIDCLEKRFAIYDKEHGNSFVKGLMEELRSLPKRPPIDMESKYAGTAKHIRQANG